MVNLAIERMTIKELIPILLCVFGWSFATTLPIVNEYVPTAVGLTAYSFLTLFGVYVVARFVRRLYDSNDRFRRCAGNMKIVLSILCVCGVMAAIGLGDYNSPFALVLAGSFLLLFKACHLPDWAGKLCSWLGPSIFSVYLMHSHGQAWGYLREEQDFLLERGVPLGFAYLFTALTVFLVCIVADFPRRLVAISFKRIK